MSFHKTYDKSRECQYLGEPLKLQYFISNEGNFASHEGASYEAYFEPIDYRGFDAFVESEAPDSGEVFVWVNIEDYTTDLDGQKIISVENMMKLIKENPLIDFFYVYDLAAGAYNFFADEAGMNFIDALGNNVRLLKDTNYEFYVDGLSLRVAPTDKIIMYAPNSKSKTTMLEDEEGEE
jgi:hypothetical protein